MAQPLAVLETGDRMVFRVRSEANPRNVYICDLLANDGVGSCTCAWWRTTLGPAVHEGRLTLKGTFPTHPDKHLQAAREHVMRQLITHMAAHEAPSYQ